MATLIERMEDYDDKEECQQYNYVERLSYFLVANDIEMQLRRKAVFPSVVRASTYKLL